MPLLQMQQQKPRARNLRRQLQERKLERCASRRQQQTRTLLQLKQLLDWKGRALVLHDGFCL